MKKQLPLLLVLTLVVVSGALFVYQQNEPVQRVDKEKLFPALNTVINDINDVEVVGHDQTIHLIKENDNWVMSSHDNHPALFDVVKALLISVSDLIVLAQKTDNPELYSRLDVEGPEQGKSSILVKLKSATGEQFSLIVGKKKINEKALPSLYVRVPTDAHALHVEGNINVEANANFWFDNNLADIPAEAIRDVSISHPGEDLISLTRSAEGDNHLELETLPEGRKATTHVVLNRLGRMMEELRATDVRQYSGDENQMIETRLTSFDGLQITIRLMQIDNRPYANFRYAIVDAERDEETDKAIVELVPVLNEKHANWFFQIPDYKYKDMTIDIEQLLRPAA